MVFLVIRNDSDRTSRLGASHGSDRENRG